MFIAVSAAGFCYQARKGELRFGEVSSSDTKAGSKRGDVPVFPLLRLMIVDIDDIAVLSMDLTT